MAIDLKSTFEKFDNEYLHFEKVPNPLHPRPDVCAFLLLDKLVPGTNDMVAGASHDEIVLNTDCRALAEVATEDGILTLIRCGVMYHPTEDCLWMFA